MGIAIAALILPLIPNISFTTQAAQPIDEFIASFTLPELSTINSPQSTFFSWVMVFELSYILIVSILLLRTLFILCKLCIILIRSHKTIIKGTSVCLLSKDAPPFSFFKWICMPSEGLTDEQQNDILIHEQAHIKHLHSIDVVFFQLFTCLNWLNPFVWLMRREIRINHEYQADEAVIQAGSNKKSYQYLLINTTYPKLAAANLYNNFNVLPLKKRIMMLNKKRTNPGRINRYFLFLPLIAAILMLVNCTSATDEKVFDNAEEASKTSIAKNEAFDVVEQMPVFPGGQQALMAFLANTIKYPEQAQKEGIQGRVIVQFIVNENGQVGDVTLARGVDASLDAEAIRVVKEMPKWTPGKMNGEDVAVKYTIPVNFALQ